MSSEQIQTLFPAKKTKICPVLRVMSPSPARHLFWRKGAPRRPDKPPQHLFAAFASKSLDACPGALPEQKTDDSASLAKSEHTPLAHMLRATRHGAKTHWIWPAHYCMGPLVTLLLLSRALAHFESLEEAWAVASNSALWATITELKVQ